MDEEDKEKKSESEDAETPEADGVQQKTISELDRADQIAERQKRENDRREELLDREESLAARKMVGGQTEAGQEAVKKKKLTDTEYANAMLKGEVNPLGDDGFS